MASTKNLTPQQDIADRLLKLHKIGILTDIKARTPKQKNSNTWKGTGLSGPQRQRIEASWELYHQVATARKGKFSRVRASRLTPFERSELLKVEGAHRAGDWLYLPNQGAQKTTVTREYLFDPRTGRKEPILFTTRTQGKGATQVKTKGRVVSDMVERYHWRERVAQEYESGQFKKNEIFGIRLFDNGMFTHIRIRTMSEFYRYVENEMHFNLRKGSDSEEQEQMKYLLDNLHVVKITVGGKDYMDVGMEHQEPKRLFRRYYRKGLKGTSL